MLIVIGLAAVAAGILLLRTLVRLVRRARPPRWIEGASEAGTLLCVGLFALGGASILRFLVTLPEQRLGLVDAALLILVLGGFALGWSWTRPGRLGDLAENVREVGLAESAAAAAPPTAAIRSAPDLGGATPQTPGDDPTRDGPQPPGPAHGGQRRKRAA